MGNSVLDRQLDREDRPCRDVVAGPDAAVVVRDDAVHDGQPEARSGLLLGEVGQEQVLLVASLDTDALVGHLDDDLPVPGCIACGHPEMPFAVHRLDGIVKEVADEGDRKSTRLNSSHGYISYAVF